MAGENKDPSNAEILTALQGMWRQQSDLVKGLEGRLGSKMDAVEASLDAKLDRVEQRLAKNLAETEEHLGARLAQEIQDRPIVVHVDMSRVSELEKRVEALAQRIAELEART